MYKIFEKKVVENGQQVLQVFTYSPLPQKSSHPQGNSWKFTLFW